jgi:hypothetical protein
LKSGPQSITHGKQASTNVTNAMNSVQREVLYNAVWRLMGHIGEIQQYGVTFDQYKSEYDTLFPNVWRIAQRVGAQFFSSSG